MSKVFVPYFDGNDITAGKEYPLIAQPDENSVEIFDDVRGYRFIFMPDSAHFPDIDQECGFVKYKHEDDAPVQDPAYRKQPGSKWIEFMEYGIQTGTAVRLLEQHGAEEALHYLTRNAERVDEQLGYKKVAEKRQYAIAPVDHSGGWFKAGTVFRVDTSVGDGLLYGEIVHAVDQKGPLGGINNARTDDCAHLKGDYGWITFTDWNTRWEDD